MSTVGYQPHQLRHIISDGATETERLAMDQGITDVIRGQRANAQVRIRGPEGDERWLAWYAIPAGDAPNSGAFLATVDITTLKDAESMLSLQATHDALTGLPNRRLLFDRLSQSLGGLERQPGTVAVLFMDLDRFKPVNDDLGHDAGDRLLQVVAGRIQAVVRGTDTVARVGGDEFVVVLGQLSIHREAARASAARVAAMVVEAVEQPVDLDAGLASVAASIGIALTSDPHEDPDGLLRDADAAMYLAKRSGGSGYTFFDEAVGTPQAAQRLVARRHHRGVPHTSAS
jgi:diguanylate cyclase (GGDEF)-like protein